MLEIVCFKWERPGYRSKFTAQHVHTMRNMVARNYRGAHRFSCITDNPEGIDGGVRVIPLWDDFKDLASPHGVSNPSCYRRLKLYSAEAADLIGPRILCIDLDMVIVGDVTPLWDRPEDVVFWQDNLNPHNRINGAMQLIRAGSRTQVWDKFCPHSSPMTARREGHWGSDQAWLSYILGDAEAKWTTADGAYSWRVHCEKDDCKGRLPNGARVVNFHGATDPWTIADRVPWIAEHYR